MSYRNATKAYQQVGTQSAVDNASPHRLISMLMDGALERVAAAKGLMQHGDVAGKGLQISKAIAIVDGLRMSLDLEAGGEIAANLDNLYEYIGRVLLQANLNNNPTQLDEVADLIHELKGAWEAIPPSIRGVPPSVAEAEARAGAR
ncbi:MAG: flagellar export chaperone FliS [Pseudomonadota bacterium]|nr:flagellar export chaperone FliS [Pseudomonadota bacterium]